MNALSRFDVAWNLPGDAQLTLTVCGQGSAIAVPAGTLALVCPIAGTADVVTGEWSVRLRKADIGIGDVQMRHDIVVSTRGACIVIAGTTQAWSALGRHGTPGSRPAFVLFPAVHRSIPASARRLVRIAHRILKDDQGPRGTYHACQLADLLDDMQSGFAPMIARCPGSLLSRKTAVFLRLQRVRNHISACAHEELDVAKLALMANYSVGHFITTFHCVFDETPYSTISRHRLESASTLLSRSTLGIADIAQTIGFQSRSSFTRAIRKHLGSSATEFREHAGDRCATRTAACAVHGQFAATISRANRSPRLSNQLK